VLYGRKSVNMICATRETLLKLRICYKNVESNPTC
jgi:hypothetical protein